MSVPPNPNQPPLPGGVSFTTKQVEEMLRFEPNLRLGRAGEPTAMTADRVTRLSAEDLRIDAEMRGEDAAEEE